jgi:hypothetical protein
VFPAIELWLAFLTLAFLFLGGFSISLARTEDNDIRAWWGRCLFIFVLLSLGATGLIGAFLHAEGLAPLGLLAGLLVVAMLWECPSAPFRAAHLGEESA